MISTWSSQRGFNAASFFSSGEQGAWFDPSDLTTLYQDSAGTTPVTAVEQPVGLMLDKSKSLVVGAEQVTNGDFSNGATGWTVNTGWAITSVATATATSASLINAFTSVQNRFYKVEFDVTSYTSGTLYVTVGGNYTLPFSTTSSGHKIAYIYAGSNNTRGIEFYGGTITCSIDNVTVKSIAGNHAYQATSASRPTLSALYNLLTYTEQFDNAAWGKVASSASANAMAAPDGTLTADKLIPDATLNQHRVDLTPTSPATSQTFTVYAKAGEYNFIGMRLNLDGAVFNLTTGVASSISAGITASAIDAGNGWWRCSIIKSAGVANDICRINVNNSATIAATFTGDGVSGIYVWGAQLIATNSLLSNTYQRVAAAGTYDSDPTKFPYYLKFNGSSSSMATNSIDFTTVTSDGLARRNLLTYPTAFDDAAWAKTRSSVTANAIVAPDGNTTADKLVEDTTVTNSHIISQTYTSTIGAAYTWSVYAKAGERTRFRFSADGAVASAYFDLSNGTVVSGAGTISSVGNGWYRCSISVASAGNASSTMYVWLVDSGTNTSYTGDGTSGIYLWGAQFEAGSSATAFQNIGTDKMTVWGGVRKASDAALGILAETGTGAQNGSILVGAPASAGAANYNFLTRGTANSSAQSASTFAAPITNVLTGIGDISNDGSILRLNGVQVTSASTDQGTGTYGNYPLYIGARNNASLYFNGNLFGLIVRGASSSASQIASGEYYMNSKTRAY